jgi:hypothetical protein
VTFDPSAPDAIHWRRWLTSALGDRGVPADATIEMQQRPVFEAAVTRLLIDLSWSVGDGSRSAHAEVLVPIRRELGKGWSGWPAYLAAVRLLRTLDSRRRPDPIPPIPPRGIDKGVDKRGQNAR